MSSFSLRFPLGLADMKGRASLIAIAVALGGAGCSSEAAKVPEVRPVQTVAVAPKTIADDRRAVGEIKPRHESDLGFRVSGKIVSRVAEIGQEVKKGDLLAKLDDQDYRNKLRSAEADVTAAEAVLAEAQSAELRSRTLLDQGWTTRANYDVALRNLRSAEAKLTAAKAALQLTKDQLAYSELRADFDGVVTAVGGEPGQVINLGQMIVRLARPADKDAVFAIAEAVFGQRSSDERPAVIVSLLSNPNITAEGIVREISPVADATTRTYQVKVTLKDPPDEMRFGASAMGRLKASTAPVIVLPGSALFDKGGQPAVWIVDKAKGTVSLRNVTIVRYETDSVVVSAGLAPGDIVVTAGVNRLRDGQAVRLLADGSGR
ncbi:MAG: efflux RND transporter periplasmic adaptor subunit [Tepidisphaeraceae bacterium]